MNEALELRGQNDVDKDDAQDKGNGKVLQRLDHDLAPAGIGRGVFGSQVQLLHHSVALEHGLAKRFVIQIRYDRHLPFLRVAVDLCRALAWEKRGNVAQTHELPVPGRHQQFSDGRDVLPRSRFEAEANVVLFSSFSIEGDPLSSYLGAEG